jgi:hypothetical protein
VAETWRSHARPPSCCLHGKITWTLLIFYYYRHQTIDKALIYR